MGCVRLDGSKIVLGGIKSRHISWFRPELDFFWAPILTNLSWLRSQLNKKIKCITNKYAVLCSWPCDRYLQLDLSFKASPFYQENKNSGIFKNDKFLLGIVDTGAVLFKVHDLWKKNASQAFFVFLFWTRCWVDKWDNQYKVFL